MKTSVIEVGGLFSALCALGVEKRLRALPGVERAEVSYASGSATVVYDETKTDLPTIKAEVRSCGYFCAGELTPSHVCKPEDPPGDAAVAAVSVQAAHAAHAHAHPAAHAPAAPPKPAAEHAGRPMDAMACDTDS